MNRRESALRASNKIEAKLFYAYKRLEELELQYEGVITTKLEPEQILDSIISHRKDVDALRFIDEAVQNEIDKMNSASTII